MAERYFTDLLLMSELQLMREEEQYQAQVRAYDKNLARLQRDMDAANLAGEGELAGLYYKEWALMDGLKQIAVRQLDHLARAREWHHMTGTDRILANMPYNRADVISNMTR